MTNRNRLSAALTLALLAALAAASSPVPVRALELIPSLGVTKSTDVNAGDAKAFGGLALRTSLLPFLKLESGIGYRQDSFASGDLVVRQWPITTSLWLAPLPMVYAGGGIGWYRTTLDYRGTLPIQDSTTRKMGVHLGGGLNLPIAPKLGLDLHGRYVFMQKDADHVQLPTTFNPDYWTTSVGLAIRF